MTVSVDSKDLEKRLGLRPNELYDYNQKLDNKKRSIEENNAIFKKNARIYSGAKDVAIALDSIKNDIPDEKIRDFIFVCAMFSVHNPEETVKIKNIIESSFKKYATTYLMYSMHEIFNSYTCEDRRKANEKAEVYLNSVRQYISGRRLDSNCEFDPESRFDESYKFNS